MQTERKRLVNYRYIFNLYELIKSTEKKKNRKFMQIEETAED